MKNANLQSRAGAIVLALSLALAGCTKSAAEKAGNVPAIPAAVATAVPAKFVCEVIAVWPHDGGAFTQGLLWRNGGLLESTGLNGRSSLREVELKSGRVLKRVDVGREFFAEGLAVVGDRAYQLTWQNGKCLVYDADTFRLEKQFSYEGEGWGLTTDGRELIMSDGTSRLRFIDPATFKMLRTVDVIESGKPVTQLNELEWIKGEVFANIWHMDRIVRIDPASGQVRGVIDCAAIVAQSGRSDEEAVLNGIAYDAAGDRLFITGKLWPKIFEVRLVTAK